MCGIYGLIANTNSKINRQQLKDIALDLAHTAGYRGYDSSGCFFTDFAAQHYKVLKANLSVQDLVHHKAFTQVLESALVRYSSGNNFSLMGHARLATNGSQNISNNNQPVSLKNCSVIHNGIVTNVDELWKQMPEEQATSQLDTEVIAATLNKEFEKTKNFASAVQTFYRQLKGSASLAIQFHNSPNLYLATNTGSLYYYLREGLFIFASEKFFIERAAALVGNDLQVQQLAAGNILKLDPRNCTITVKPLDAEFSDTEVCGAFQLEEKVLVGKNKSDTVLDPSAFIADADSLRLQKLVSINTAAIAKLKRCTKCILPETFPFISYDAQGVCNYCNNYVPKFKSKNPADLATLLSSYPGGNGKPNCIVPLSGGRDSSYSVHVLVKEFGLKPLTYTYDWGMVTDLARRNIARVTGKLGLENIIVSADINQKRKFIRQNIEAWLKRPNLGMIPLFMSGDKSFHLYLHKIKQHTGISLNIWGENFLEKTDFKVGFAGVAPEFEKEKIYSLKTGNMFKMLGFIGKEVMLNPAYLNASVLDNLKAQYSRFFMPKSDYYNFFDFYPWHEDTVDSVIQNEYDWEKSPDAESTWRIGDGTSAFYNYIYLRVAGFSEFDTFRSNQIREGMLDRETALQLTTRDNQVRFATMRWYLQIVGLDFENVVKKINTIPSLYPQ